MNPYRYRVALRATHPSADLAPLFDELDLVPRRIWRAGEPRATPQGQGVYADSYGVADLTPGNAPRDWGREQIEDFLHAVQRRLSAHRGTLNDFTRRGGRCGLYIGLCGEHNFGFELSPELSGALAGLNLTLGFDILPPESDA